MFFMPFGPGGCAWLCVVFGACFVLVCLASGCCGWGLGGAMWSGFLGFVLTVALAFWLGFCWFCLESLILAQDERWRRA